MTELHFSDGLVGCPEWQRFTMVRNPELAPVVLLESADQPGLSLPAVSPWMVKPDYAPNLDEVDRAALGPTGDGELEWLVVLNIQSQPLQMSANLLGPLVVNRRTGAARQVILSQSGYSAAHPVGVPPEAAGGEVDDARADTPTR